MNLGLMNRSVTLICGVKTNYRLSMHQYIIVIYIDDLAQSEIHAYGSCYIYKNRESRSSAENSAATVKNIISAVHSKEAPLKDKVISAKVSSETWDAFTSINRSRGMTNNSALNMLISNYVHDHKDILNGI